MTRTEDANYPDLSGLRVLELATTPGPAFAACLLADFGADVIVVEAPGGSALRRLGPREVQAVWWPIIARGKRSIALDANRDSAKAVLGKLIGSADIVIRDSKASPGAEAINATSDKLLDVYMYSPGEDHPDKWCGSTEHRLAAASSGAMALTGEKDGPPVQPEFPLADYTAGMMAAMSALTELRASRVHLRPPRPISIGLHEVLARMNEWQLIFASGRGYPELRNGNRFPMNVNIGNVFRTRDGKLLTLSAATAPVASRLLTLIGGDQLRDDPRFSSAASRRENMDALELIIGDWMAEHDAEDILQMGSQADVVLGPILDSRDMIANPQIAARENVIDLESDGVRRLAMPNVLPRIDGVGSKIRHPGPAIGAHSDAILAELGIVDHERDALRLSQAVWTEQQMSEDLPNEK